MQLQGVDSAALSGNIATVSDTPWAVGGAHRNDFTGTGTSHVCVMLSGGDCIKPDYTVPDYSACAVRCWGHGSTARPPALTATLDSVQDAPNADNDGFANAAVWEYKATDAWAYDKAQQQAWGAHAPSAVPAAAAVPPFNPQGYLFTLAGSGAAGFSEGLGAAAQFSSPHDVAADASGNVFVADTGNNRIRKVTAAGLVTTVAGDGTVGHTDGPGNTARFSGPTGVALTYIGGAVVLYVADRGNHRVRRIDIDAVTDAATVSCYAGRCGKGTESFTQSHSPALPAPGYADGSGMLARFDAPTGVAVSSAGGLVYVADTNNHAVRLITADAAHTVYTVAGSFRAAASSASDMAACPPPCLEGVPGHRDGNLTHAQFYYPKDVEVTAVGELLVAEHHSIRLISLPGAASVSQGVQSTGRVTTLAGAGTEEGERDGAGDWEARFNGPSGVTAAQDGTIFVADSVSCKVRRVTPAMKVAASITCATRLVDIVRPSGCSSYDPPVSARDKTVGAVFGNTHYNYAYRNTSDSVEGDELIGREIKACLGSPPAAALDKRAAATGDNLVVDDGATSVKEDTGDGTVIKLLCPTACGASLAASAVRLSGTAAAGYSDDSALCQAAVHSGIISDATGGLIQVTLLTEAGSTGVPGGTANGLTSTPVAAFHTRLFSVAAYAEAAVQVETVAGHAAATLESGCGFRDAQPAQASLLRTPAGIDVWRTGADATSGPTQSSYVFIADTGNHRVRALSAVCAVPCENGGTCVGTSSGAASSSSSGCQCAAGWSGYDCTVPVCSAGLCTGRQLCVAPETCGCVPGYSGAACDAALCALACANGGACAAPDACACAAGWWGSDCSVPVCSQTCGNGGSCTAPDVCTCAEQWEGPDCRVPVCTQTCLNGGYCTAPDTCTCPPQWTGYDCALPVCTQGEFALGFEAADAAYFAVTDWQQYSVCDAAVWCTATNGFDCGQGNRTQSDSPPDWGASGRATTGWKEKPPRCLMLELSATAVTQLPYLQADGITTAHARYSPLHPYDPTGVTPAQDWFPISAGTVSRTQPWAWTPDRQVAMGTRVSVAQGRYVCANSGNCTAPGVCACAAGWSGFDCRTPVCEQGYWEPAQTTFVHGQGTAAQILVFEPFLDPAHAAHRQPWPYSNPAYSEQVESFADADTLTRSTVPRAGARYLSIDPAGVLLPNQFQGGYSCSIRAWTEFENSAEPYINPNFYSQYMDTAVQANGITYTHWVGMQWPPTHMHTAALQQTDPVSGRVYVYTDVGYMRGGIWSVTGAAWQKGICIPEFHRVCSAVAGAAALPVDLVSGASNATVQDTDLAYRPRVSYDAWKETAAGRWSAANGDCVDHVLRGCHNNGTCIAPNTCKCAAGWEGTDCNTPVCTQECLHGGACTMTDVCTCAAGWSGFDCSTPLCAQDCNNGGVCVAPDVCKCKQWATEWVDGRQGGGRPLFRKPNGDPQNTGWTGFDCSVPICTQAQSFLKVIASPPAPASQITTLGGHGPDGTLNCTGVRCAVYDAAYVTTAGTSFQSGCGFDPLQTGCCVRTALALPVNASQWVCSICDTPLYGEHNFTCGAAATVSPPFTSEQDVPGVFWESGRIRLCGPDHSPFPYYKDAVPGRDHALYSTDLMNSNVTGGLFLCRRAEWQQGENSSAAAAAATPVSSGAGSDTPLQAGRHTRINYSNYTSTVGVAVGTNASDAPTVTVWNAGTELAGEGVYACYNGGSCVGPDSCTCADGWDGFDCNTPVCRHLQPSGAVSACENGGLCQEKDDCRCIQTDSVLWKVQPGATQGRTGWTGTDCSTPMCVQGFYDPFCAGLEQAPGGEGCYRCANGGNCTAPDVCDCAPGWGGFDCRTPTCQVVANAMTRISLRTVDEEKVHAFEQDPCSMTGLHHPVPWQGALHTRGNCTAPNRCSCTCFAAHQPQRCGKRQRKGDCRGPWQDPLQKYRAVLRAGTMFGTRSCARGYEGLQDPEDRFATCHMVIFEPSWVQRQSIPLILGGAALGLFGSLTYLLVRRRLRRKYLRAKIERRRSRRGSELGQTMAL